jgi:pyruvate/2-oxoacid:ferredoxin oxidoreductase alpha subunit
VREAVEHLNANGARVAAFAPRILAPLPNEELQAFIDSCSRIVVVELSYSAQFHHYLRSQVDLPRGRTQVLARSGGKTLSVAEVMETVLQEVTA